MAISLASFSMYVSRSDLTEDGRNDGEEDEERPSRVILDDDLAIQHVHSNETGK